MTLESRAGHSPSSLFLLHFKIRREETTIQLSSCSRILKERGSVSQKDSSRERDFASQDKRIEEHEDFRQ